jgi:hypothetical protein
MKKINYSFKIDSIPGIKFTYGATSYRDCKKFNPSLTKKEYEDALKVVEDKIKARDSKNKKKPLDNKIKKGTLDNKGK